MELGLPSGNKNQIKKFPKQLKEKYPTNLLRGIADADFTFYLRKKRNTFIPKIIGSFSNSYFIKEISEMLSILGIGHTTRIQERNKYTEYRIIVEGKTRVNEWLEIISFNNPKHLKKVKRWKEFR